MDSRVLPELRPFLSMMPREDFKHDDIGRLRSMGAAFGGPELSDDSCTVSDRMIPGPAGAPAVRLRLYEPRRGGQDRPGVLYIHGGGYILGTPEMTDASCVRMAAALGAVVASVDYRLAPENPYPAPLEDCYAALLWFSEQAAKLRVDQQNIAVVGGSAGGGLTAALCLLARDRKGPSIAFQGPLYPMIDDRNITSSSREFTDPRLWSRAKNTAAWEMYLGPLYGGDVSRDEIPRDGISHDAIPYYAAPSRAEDLSGLPPAYTLVGELDLFRDETIDYVTRLLQAGVPTEFHIYPGCFHGFDMFPCETGRRAESELLAALKRALVKNEEDHA